MPDDPHAQRALAPWRWTGAHRPPFADVPGPGQVSVWDFPRPPVIAPEPRRVEVWHRGVLVARSDRAVRVLETAGAPTVYVPPADVVARLETAPGASFCEWKGRAAYFDVVVDGGRASKVAWSYPAPVRAFAAIAGWVAFYPSELDCRLGGERVQPQPGGFYGGWVTAELAGPIKGGPGTHGW